MSPLRRHPAPAGNAASCTPLLLVLLALVVPVVALAPAAPACGQEAPAAETNDDWQPLESFDEAISVEVTNIEVWVTDRRGDPVTGLDADDFVLTEDGEPVAVTNFSSFEEEASGSWAERPAADAPEDGDAAAPRAEAAGAAVAGEAGADDVDPEERLHLAILIDNWNLRPADRARVFEDLRAFLRERLHPRDRVMVMVHDRALALVQELTADPDELLAALARIERSAMANVQLETERRATYRNIRDEFTNPNTREALFNGGDIDPCTIAWGQMQNLAHQFATAVLSHTQRSGGALASAGGLLAGVPGRKILLYVGSGLPQQAGSEVFHFLTELCPGRQSEVASWYSQFDLTWLYEEVARQANANGLTLYTVEASVPETSGDIAMDGLVAGMTSASGGGQGSGGLASAGTVTSSGQTYHPSVTARRSAELDSEAGLFYVANETGGRAILNAADFSRDFERLASELRTYYSLGFTPGHGGDGQLHRIEVKLAPGVGDGYRVRHRHSYRDKPYEVRMAEKIRGVAQFGTESNRMHIRVETGEATATAGGYRVPIRVWVPLDEMTLVEPPGGATEASHRAGRLRVMMAVSDAAGNLGPVRQKLVTVEVGRADAGSDPAGRREHLVEVDLDLPTADHVVALGLRDELGGETSFVRHEIRLDDVPPISATGEESRR